MVKTFCVAAKVMQRHNLAKRVIWFFQLSACFKLQRFFFFFFFNKLAALKFTCQPLTTSDFSFFSPAALKMALLKIELFREAGRWQVQPPGLVLARPRPIQPKLSH